MDRALRGFWRVACQIEKKKRKKEREKENLFAGVPEGMCVHVAFRNISYPKQEN